MVRTASSIISKAIADCASLDAFLKRRNETPRFLDGCVFHEPKCVEEIDHLAFIEVCDIYEGKSPRFQALRSLQRNQAQGKLYLHQFRELLRDGATVKQALPMFSESIKEQTDMADAVFLTDITGIINDFKKRPERFTRSMSEWIVRGWLTLRLYECAPDGLEAYRRASEAALLLGMRMVGDGPFNTAWRNVRSRLFGKANPYFSQSAGVD